MEIKQIYTGCLAQGSYYIKCNGEAAIVDPLREVQQYIDMAEKDGVKIKYIFETHFHADFVSGHVTLAEKTGAEIVYGPTAQTEYNANIARDGQRFKVGKLEIEVLHTPGHTMESSCFLLYDKRGNQHSLFSGDTVFLGDVGRPDLAQKAADMTQEELAGMLYDSIKEKIMPLNDDVIIYPGHGAGSACGKNMSSETVGTIGHEKANNYALRADMTREEFITEVLDGLLPPLEYFGFNVQMNKQGYTSIDEVIKNGNNLLDSDQFEIAANDTDAVILDVRHQSEFVKGFIPRSIFVGLAGGFAPWVGALLVDVKQPLLLVVEEGLEEEAVIRLSRVGFDNVIGILKGGFMSWTDSGKEVDKIDTIEAGELEGINAPAVFDVRKPGEFTAGHLEFAKSTPLDLLNKYLSEFPNSGDFYLHCEGGYRSVIANSILKKHGIHNGIDVLGGYKAIAKTDIPITEYVCPSTLK
ncbi:MAG: MBL fold metallo-hydrolase [Flavobacteriales bacterium]|nr:MBL fold metallo-hydrolase [Flavobacteriales bacterium]MBT6174326.1 MBL fold metallo-hydrolase [Flavobacteriales bacterium]